MAIDHSTRLYERMQRRLEDSLKDVTNGFSEGMPDWETYKFQLGVYKTLELTRDALEEEMKKLIKAEVEDDDED